MLSNTPMTGEADGSVDNALSRQVVRRNQVEKLPMDVMIGIFRLCCPSYNYQHQSTSPVVLCQVCRRWRDVIVELPDLWTFLHFRVSLFELSKPLATIKIWLSRAKNRPLIVNFTVLEDPTVKSPLNILPQVNNVLNSISRLSPSSTADNHLTMAVTAAQVIGNVQTAVEFYTWALPGERSFEPGSGSVKINVIRCADIVYGLEGYLPLSNFLTVVDLADPDGLIEITLGECHSILSNFPMLERCSIRVGRLWETLDAMTTVPHLMMHLKILSLFWSEAFDVCNILDSIYAPSLEYLELDGTVAPPNFVGDVGWFYPEIMQFLVRSRPPLRVLELSKMGLGGIDIFACLALVPNLHALILDDCYVDADYLNFCTTGWHPQHEEARRTLMNVQMVQLVSCSIGSFVDFLFEFLKNEEARSQVRLNDLRVYDCGRFPQEILLELERWPQLQFTLSPVGPDYTVFI